MYLITYQVEVAVLVEEKIKNIAANFDFLKTHLKNRRTVLGLRDSEKGDKATSREKRKFPEKRTST